jgi:hypothetical protein
MWPTPPARGWALRHDCLSSETYSSPPCSYRRNRDSRTVDLTCPETTCSFDYNLCYLTNTEIRRLHRRFGHPSAEKLHRVLKRSGHDDVDRQVINHLTKYCSFCQKYGRSPGRFKFTLCKDLDFNYSVYVDIIYINSSPVLYIIDEATRY